MGRFAVLVLAALALGAFAGPIDLQGHRGTRGLAPENTLAAFAKALSIGVTTLEMDVGVTRDGVMVVAHDETLNPDITRGPDGEWLARRGPAMHELTFAELERYDVGRINPLSGYAKRFPRQEGVDGTRIPRLADVFALVRRAGNAQVRLNIETKLTPTAPHEAPAPEPFARQLIDEVRKAGFAARVTIQSFDWRTLQVVQREAPEIPTVYLTSQQKFLDNVCSGPRAGTPAVDAADCAPSAWTAGFQLRDHGSVPRLIKAAGGKAWSPFFRDVDAGKVAEAHALGLAVIVWAVNEPAPGEIDALLDLGVDGIINDRPDLVREALARRGLPLPAPTPVRP